MSSAGPLALVGGSEWRDGCDFDRDLLEAAATDQVLILPTAAAYEWPARSVEAAQRWFEQFKVQAKGLPVLQRSDSSDPDNVEAVRSARFIYLSDGSPLHLRSVIKDTPLWQALVEAWQGGAVVAGSAAGAMVLGDPMVDPRGGAFTLGLGLVSKLAVVPQWERWTTDKARRMTQLMPADTVVAEIEDRTALIRWEEGRWTTAGMGSVTLSLDHQPVNVENLKG